jgi:hypothetical protein
MKGKRNTSGTTRFVVAMMQLNTALLGVRHDTRFVAGERKRSPRDSELAHDGEQRCEQPLSPLGVEE